MTAPVPAVGHLLLKISKSVHGVDWALLGRPWPPHMLFIVPGLALLDGVYNRELLAVWGLTLFLARAHAGAHMKIYGCAVGLVALGLLAGMRGADPGCGRRASSGLRALN